MELESTGICHSDYTEDYIIKNIEQYILYDLISFIESDTKQIANVYFCGNRHISINKGRVIEDNSQFIDMMSKIISCRINGSFNSFNYFVKLKVESDYIRYYNDILKQRELTDDELHHLDSLLHNY